MPVIELPSKRKTSARKRGYIPTERAAMASNLYNTTTWRKIRNAYLMANPECEICAELGQITYATEVHHHHHISDARNNLEAMDRAYDDGNLISVCKRCHMRYHGLVDSKRYPSEADKVFLDAYKKVIKKHVKRC